MLTASGKAVEALRCDRRDRRGATNSIQPGGNVLSRGGSAHADQQLDREMHAYWKYWNGKKRGGGFMCMTCC